MTVCAGLRGHVVQMALRRSSRFVDDDVPVVSAVCTPTTLTDSAGQVAACTISSDKALSAPLTVNPDTTCRQCPLHDDMWCDGNDPDGRRWDQHKLYDHGRGERQLVMVMSQQRSQLPLALDLQCGRYTAERLHQQ